jgi:hypothetical protein
MSQKHLSPAEFNEFMKERHKKIMEKNAGKIAFCVGVIVVPPELEKVWPEKLIQVECCRCGMPIYLTNWVHEEMLSYYVPWDDSKHPWFCEFCLPPEIVRGTRRADIAAVLQHTGENQP